MRAHGSAATPTAKKVDGAINGDRVCVKFADVVARLLVESDGGVDLGTAARSAGARVERRAEGEGPGPPVMPEELLEDRGVASLARADG